MRAEAKMANDYVGRYGAALRQLTAQDRPHHL